ncbi:1797_t:CDS:2 [Acaulospora morrowiae]|uniref:1797_t:CDS:1 n=1 Tax=Acaulospora morrowiae TaxID=94023 RepID=A0A9N9GLZ3_9GLOM|nr:1797_t:CDS:2 [Acaulospora morrowiae]
MPVRVNYQLLSMHMRFDACSIARRLTIYINLDIRWLAYQFPRNPYQIYQIEGENIFLISVFIIARGLGITNVTYLLQLTDFIWQWVLNVNQRRVYRSAQPTTLAEVEDFVMRQRFNARPVDRQPFSQEDDLLNGSPNMFYER